MLGVHSNDWRIQGGSGMLLRVFAEVGRGAAKHGAVKHEAANEPQIKHGRPTRPL